MSEGKTVRVTRRRRSSPSQSGGRERAATPRRGQREESARPNRPSGTVTSGTGAPGYGTTPSPTSQGYGQGFTGQTGGGTQLPLGGLLNLLGGRKLPPLLILGLIAVAVLCVCVMLGIALSGGGGLGGLVDEFTTVQDPYVEEPVYAEPTAVPVATRTPRPFVPPVSVSGSAEDTWLVMLYQDADDKILEQDIYLDLNEAERVGSGDQVHIVSQVDRYAGGYTGDGNWSSTKRFYVTPNSDLNRVQSQEIADLGEVNMADGDTLVDFVTWAVDTFPSDKYVLIMSDHGMGWPGGWSDGSTTSRGNDNVALSAMGDYIFLMELDEALQEIRATTGIDKFEMIGMDACLMGHLEVYTMLADHARYAVASQETEPALGWAYASFLSELKANPAMSGAELGNLIVDSYISEDQRIVDDQARAEWLSRGSPLGGMYGMPTAAQLAQQLGGGVTLSAIDLGQIPALNDSVNAMAYTLQGARQNQVARARSYAQSFTSIFGQQVPASYLDLGHLTQLLRSESGSSAVAAAAEDVLASLDRAVIAEKHGRQKPGATGVSIYYPNSQLFQNQYAGANSYTTVANAFAAQSLWDDFLTYHYTGRPFEMTSGVVSVPDRGATIEGPGAGAVTVSPVELSSDVAAPGRPVLMSTDISGENVGYVQLFVGFYDQSAGSIFVADQDYLESAETRQIDGIYYPVWPSDGFTMEFEWEPIVFGISDGVDTVVALFKPEVYGATFEEAVYSVDGIYTYAADGESRYARLYFSAGVLRQAFGFTGELGVGAPREITPSTGDSFTVLDKWMDLDANGNPAGTTMLEGGSLTFGDSMFTWEELDAAAGAYVVGFVVQNLDGNSYETLDVVTVQ